MISKNTHNENQTGLIKDLSLSKLSIYLRGTIFGLIGKLLTLWSSFATLWLLNKVLTKEQYGVFAFAMTIMSVFAIVGTVGQDRSLFYRLSGEKKIWGRLEGGSFVAHTIRWVLIVDTGLYAFLIIFSYLIRNIMPDIMFWLVIIGLLIPLSSINQILTAWFQSQQRFTEAIFIPRIEEILKVIFLIFVFFLWPTRTGIAVSILIAAIGTIIAWMIAVPPETFQLKRALGNKDIIYGVKLLITKITHMGIERIDLIMIGFLSTQLMTAEYSVGVKIALFARIGNDLLQPIFTPRMRHNIVNHNFENMKREYKQNRLFAFSTAIAVAVFFLFSGEWLLSIFGDYQKSYSVLMILTAGSLISIGFGPTGRYLNMAGYANISLTFTIILFLGNCVLNYLLIPPMGGKGAALSTVFTLLCVNSAVAMFMWWRDKMAALSPLIVISIAFGCIGLLLVAFELINPHICGFSLLVILVSLIFHHRKLWFAETKQIFLPRRNAKNA